METWKSIKSYEGIYEVSTFGNVKSLERSIWMVRNNSNKIIKEKILKPNIRSGYKSVQLNKNGKGNHFTIHRLVALAFIQNIENKPQVNHIDGNKLNNNVNNLEWCTNSENIIHSIYTGLKITLKGHNCSWSKLNESKVLEIRKSKLTQKELSKIYNVSISCIQDVIYLKRWKHI